jgi:putative oxidoreductase
MIRGAAAQAGKCALLPAMRKDAQFFRKDAELEREVWLTSGRAQDEPKSSQAETAALQAHAFLCMSEAATGRQKKRRIFSVKVRRNVKLDQKDRHHQPCRMNSLNRFADPVYCIVRLIVGLTYACHGGQKLFGFPGGGHGVDGLAFIAGIIELVGGFLIAFGLFTRIAAFLASGEMAVAYFMFYVGVVPTLEAKFFPIMNGGELALLYCWVFFFIIFYGPGRWSIDALWRKDRSSSPST